jgi:CheY-like chemotaxis protein
LLGHRVDVAHSGVAGLATAIATRPDTILLDIGMPVMDGCEVARRLRATGDFDDALMIAISGHGMPSDRRRSAAAGINHHLVKPSDPGDLLKLLGDPPAMGPAEPHRAIGSTAVASMTLA